MSTQGWTLELRRSPALRLDLRGITPKALDGLDAAAIEKLPLGDGKALTPLGEYFDVKASAEPGLRLLGDLSRVDRIGWAMDGGRLVVESAAGHHVGSLMQAGELVVKGNVGHQAGCELRGGRLEIEGDAGDFVGSTLPGSMDGMRGGTLVVRGRVGARCADRMRRGSLVVFGNAGEFLGSRMVAGTIALGGRAGVHPGHGMRRGSIVFAGDEPAIAPTFAPARVDAAVFWQLLARDLAPHGGAFASLPSRRIGRWLGDLGAGGKGELIVPG